MKQDNLKRRLQQLPTPKPSKQQFEQAAQTLSQLSQTVTQGPYLKRVGMRVEIRRLLIVAMVTTVLAVTSFGVHTYLQQQEEDSLDELSVVSMLVL